MRLSTLGACGVLVVGFNLVPRTLHHSCWFVGSFASSRGLQVKKGAISGQHSTVQIGSWYAVNPKSRDRKPPKQESCAACSNVGLDSGSQGAGLFGFRRGAHVVGMMS